MSYISIRMSVNKSFTKEIGFHVAQGFITYLSYSSVDAVNESSFDENVAAFNTVSCKDLVKSLHKSIFTMSLSASDYQCSTKHINQ